MPEGGAFGWHTTLVSDIRRRPSDGNPIRVIRAIRGCSSRALSSTTSSEDHHPFAGSARKEKTCFRNRRNTSVSAGSETGLGCSTQRVPPESSQRVAVDSSESLRRERQAIKPLLLLLLGSGSLGGWRGSLFGGGSASFRSASFRSLARRRGATRDKRQAKDQREDTSEQFAHQHVDSLSCNKRLTENPHSKRRRLC